MGLSASSGEPIAAFQGRGNDANDSGIVAISRTGTNPSGSIGELRFATGSDLNKQYATIICQSDGSTTSTSLPGLIRFNTTASGGTSPTERMRIDSSGNVRIGQISGSSAKLSVYGSQVRFQGASTGTGESDGFGIGNNGATSAFIWNYENGIIQIGTNNTERMRIDSSGNVGIGNTAPAAKLHLEATSEQLRITHTSIVSYRHEAHSNGDYSINKDGTERMRIDSSGNVGIGTSNPTAKLDVNFYGLTANAIDIKNTWNGNNAYFMIFRNSAGTIQGSILGSTTSSISFNTSSDYRLKENVVDIADGITRVKQLQPKRFNFIADSDATVDGFLAHEAQTVVPEAVTGEKDGEEMQGIDQSKLVPLLTAALKEAIAKIETLEQRLSDAGIA